MYKQNTYTIAHEMTAVSLLWYVKICSEVIQLRYRETNYSSNFNYDGLGVMELCQETTGHALRYIAAQICEPWNNVFIVCLNHLNVD